MSEAVAILATALALALAELVREYMDRRARRHGRKRTRRGDTGAGDRRRAADREDDA